MTTKRKRIASVIFLVLLCVWLGLSPRVSSSLYADRLFHPDLGNGSQQELRSFNETGNHEVYFPTTDGTKLHGWLYVKPGSKRIVLVHPGNAGDMAGRLYLTRLLLQAGASVFQYEPRGFGASPGKPGVRTICEDGVAAYDYVVQTLGYRPEQVVLYGMSLGASVATHVVSERPAGGLVIHAGFSSLERIAKENVPFLRIYPSWLFPTPRLDNAAILEAKGHPRLIILHGEKDAVIPISHGEEIYARAASPKEFVKFPKSGHADFDPDDIKSFVATMRSFFAKLP